MPDEFSCLVTTICIPDVLSSSEHMLVSAEDDLSAADETEVSSFDGESNGSPCSSCDADDDFSEKLSSKDFVITWLFLCGSTFLIKREIGCGLLGLVAECFSGILLLPCGICGLLMELGLDLGCFLMIGSLILWILMSEVLLLVVVLSLVDCV